MNKLNNFLWKLFSITMALSWDARSIALADTSDTEEETVDTRWGVYSRTKQGEKLTICPDNQYVYSCGEYVVGYNWLQSVLLTAPNGTKKITQKYDIGNNAYDKMEQMRAFFKSGTAIKYQENDTSPILTTTSSNKTIKEDRDFILGLLCNPLNSNITISCAPCPDGGKVSKSDVKVGNDPGYEETDLMLIRNSWNFNTIADCYITDFEDASGSFIYINPTTANTSTAEKCYYTNTNPNASKFVAGDSISGFVANASAANVRTVEPDIPE